MNSVERAEVDTIAAASKDGFAVLSGVFSTRESEDLLQKLASSSLPRSRAGIRHILRHSAVAALANDARMLSFAKDALGPQAFPFHATLFDKSPDANWLVVWHQDTALPLRDKHETSGWGPWSTKDGVTYAHAPAGALEQVLAIRVHLDDSTAENGPLRLLPGTHNRGVLSDDEICRLSGEIEPVACTVKSGGIVLMRPLLVHASSKSTSQMSRRVLHIEYAATQSFDGLELAC